VGDGGNPTGGNSSTGGAPDTGPRACPGQTVKATGVPTLLDDFSGMPSDGIPPNDGRAGLWTFADHTNPAGTTPNAWTSGAMHYSSATAGYAVAPWDPGAPWQWAQVSTLLQKYADPADCYDASVFAGIEFDASSASTPLDKIRIQFGAPGDSPLTGETYNCPELTLTSAMTHYQVSFASCQLPVWSAIANKSVPVNALESFTVVVRSVESQSNGTVEGESLTTWDITIDDVAFYY